MTVAHSTTDFQGQRAFESQSPLTGAVEQLRIEVHRNGDEVRVELVGEIDLATVGQLDRKLHELRESGFRQFVVDLRELTFMDSTGLHLLIRWDAYARQDGIGFALIQGSPSVRRIFEVTGLLDRLRFCAS